MVQILVIVATIGVQRAKAVGWAKVSQEEQFVVSDSALSAALTGGRCRSLSRACVRGGGPRRAKGKLVNIPAAKNGASPPPGAGCTSATTSVQRASSLGRLPPAFSLLANGSTVSLSLWGGTGRPAEVPQEEKLVDARNGLASLRPARCFCKRAPPPRLRSARGQVRESADWGP